MRQSCDVLVEADVEKSMKDGIKWFISPNKVILTSGVNGVLAPVSISYFLSIRLYIEIL